MKYTNEKNTQILIAVLKAHGIRNIIASPGTTNISFVRSLQNDSFFHIVSCVDERSAAYMACGMANESGFPVVLSCTGATASRNYLPGMTEAYYRKLPVLSVTSTKEPAHIGHLIPQFVDRSVMPNDVQNLSVQLPRIKEDNDWWECEIQANKAVLALFRKGGGPVHINLETNYSRVFDVDVLPDVRIIQRITQHTKQFPDLPMGKIAMFIGAHKKFSVDETLAIDRFCKANNAVVFCDYTSGYSGEFRVNHSLYSSQRNQSDNPLCPDLTVHIGEITGDYYANRIIGSQVWRVSPDGELRDTFRKLKYVFEMPETSFFEHYANADPKQENDSYLKLCGEATDMLQRYIPDLPLSNIWMAHKLHSALPEHALIHFGILNSLRAWNFFKLSKTIDTNANVGGFGIDGCVSTLIGASLVNKNRLCFGVIGDLAFFYDLNVLGNRFIGKNLRILLVNNGIGTEFINFSHPASKFGDSADEFIAGGGHFGNKSTVLVKNFAQNLGFEYMQAATKEEFDSMYPHFVTPEPLERPIVFEVFTDKHDESAALEAITALHSQPAIPQGTSKTSRMKSMIRSTLNDDTVNKVKNIIRKHRS